MGIPEQLAALEQRVTAIEQARAAEAQESAAEAQESAAEAQARAKLAAKMKAHQEEWGRIDAVMSSKSAEIHQKDALLRAQYEFDCLPRWKKALSRFWFGRTILRLPANPEVP